MSLMKVLREAVCSMTVGAVILGILALGVFVMPNPLMADGTKRKTEILSDRSYALRMPGYVQSMSLAAGVAESYSKPAGVNTVYFSGTANFYVNYATAASIPGDLTDGTASELNPTVRYVQGVTSISLISPSNCVVTMGWTNR